MLDHGRSGATPARSGSEATLPFPATVGLQPAWGLQPLQPPPALTDPWFPPVLTESDLWLPPGHLPDATNFREGESPLTNLWFLVTADLWNVPSVTDVSDCPVLTHQSRTPVVTNVWVPPSLTNVWVPPSLTNVWVTPAVTDV
ncbi:hypothetical protein P692DRAFT_201862408 [Suillus brevipes Sb2]|nr:hypothetical protein P692DRAFT_201862408 [Suillus brevipes Sb2]